jgi:hypothetical protein
MKPVALVRGRSFLEEIGFVTKCQTPVPPAADTLLAWLRAKGHPTRTRDQINVARANYVPPRWVGYYVAHDHAFAHDGRFHCAVPTIGPMLDLLEELRMTHFAHGPALLPVITGSDEPNAEPAMILLHDTAAGTFFLEPFEGGIQWLRDQHFAPKENVS